MALTAVLIHKINVEVSQSLHHFMHLLDSWQNRRPKKQKEAYGKTSFLLAFTMNKRKNVCDR